jgi:hypothetical protein
MSVKNSNDTTWNGTRNTITMANKKGVTHNSACIVLFYLQGVA